MHRKLLALATLTVATIVLTALPQHTVAHHSDNGHGGMLYPGAAQYEMNARTTARQPIVLELVTFSAVWAQTLTAAVNEWNSALYPSTGFDVFLWDNNTGTIEVEGGSGLNACPNQYSHGCVLNWIPHGSPNGPTGRIYMHSPFLTAPNHKLSDLLHELGHVLLHANEHYPAYNCSSIMGHSSPESAGGAGYCASGTLTDVQQHDIADFIDTFGVEDAPNAAYVLVGFGMVHHWEGGYLGGVGRTIHQEVEYRIDRSTSGIGGAYSTWETIGRRVGNEDDVHPETAILGPVPGNGIEWCYKTRGKSATLSPGSPGEWGPYSKRYCVARSSVSGNGVIVASDRNGNAHFRVWNLTNATIVNVQLRTAPSPGTMICGPWTIPPGGLSPVCASSIGGPGYLNVWYDNSWVPHDTIGYDQ